VGFAVEKALQVVSLATHCTDCSTVIIIIIIIIVIMGADTVDQTLIDVRSGQSHTTSRTASDY
jgi:hypothetical protein